MPDFLSILINISDRFVNKIHKHREVSNEAELITYSFKLKNVLMFVFTHTALRSTLYDEILTM